jgi:membrane-associated protease RseP (regulator of RpoE activity)
MSYLLVFCTVSLLIILHELGHFLAAKRMGIPIARFSVGLGPKVWGFKMGETEYWLSMIPCGGYVMPARKIYQPLRRLEIPLTVGGWVLLAGLTLYLTALDLARVARGMLG